MPESGSEFNTEGRHPAEHKEQKEWTSFSKKSRLYVLTAFSYLNDPGQYPEFKNLHEYLNDFYTHISQGNTDVLEGFPENCRTVEQCMEEMSDEEIRREIGSWKLGGDGNGASEKRQAEYEQYLINILSNPPENLPVAGEPVQDQAPAELSMAEGTNGAHDYKVGDSQLEKNRYGQLELFGKYYVTRKKDKKTFSRLQRVTVPGSPSKRSEVEQPAREALTELMELSDFQKNPNISAPEDEDSVFQFTFGRGEKTLGVFALSREAVTDFLLQNSAGSPEDVAAMVSLYIENKHANLSGKSFGERKRVWDEMHAFEEMLFNARVPEVLSAEPRNFGRFLWDKGFEKIFAAKLGPERMAELQKPSSENFIQELEKLSGNKLEEFILQRNAPRAIARICGEYGLHMEEGLSVLAQKLLNPQQLAVWESYLAMDREEAVKKIFPYNPRSWSTVESGALKFQIFRKLLADQKNVVYTEAPNELPQQTEPVSAEEKTQTAESEPAPFLLEPEPEKLHAAPQVDAVSAPKVVAPKGQDFKEPNSKWMQNQPEYEYAPSAEVNPSYKMIAGIMDRYGRLTREYLEQTVVERDAVRDGQRVGVSRVTHLNTEMANKILEEALQAMGFWDDYQKALLDYKRNPAFWHQVEDRVAKQLNDLGLTGAQRVLKEQELRKAAEGELDNQLLLTAVEQFYHIRPETLKREQARRELPEGFTEVQRSVSPEYVVLNEQATGYRYLAIPGQDKDWEKVPVPQGVNINSAEELNFLAETFQQLVEANKKEVQGAGKSQRVFKPGMRLQGDVRTGKFVVELDRNIALEIPVQDFLNKEIFRQDQRRRPGLHPWLKEILVENFAATQDRKIPYTPEQQNQLEALESLLLDTPLEGEASFGDQLKLLALKARLKQQQRQRVLPPGLLKAIG